jgi:hypothetical protein
MNWYRKSKDKDQFVSELKTSLLYNEDTFYQQFVSDLLEVKEEVIIESPYITKSRMNMLKPLFEKLVERGIHVFIITRASHEHDAMVAVQSEAVFIIWGNRIV